MNNGNIFFSVLCAQSKRGQPNDEGGEAVGVPAQMQGSNDCGLAHDDVKPEDTTQGDRPARPVTCPSSVPSPTRERP